MNIRVLKAFLAVSRYASITRAAECLHISQPALSRQIAELESELNARLFERSTRRLTLTESGLLFEERARQLVALAEEAKRDVALIGGSLAGEIRLGCVESSAIEFVADAIEEESRTHPNVRFQLYSADGDDIRAALDQGRIDLGILLEPVEAAKYDSIVLPFADRWGVVVAEDSPLAGLDSLPVDKLAELPLILPRRWIVLDEVASWLGIERGELRVFMHHNLPTLSLPLVKRGLGVLLCVEGSYGIRPTAGVKFIPLSPERRTGHKLVRRRNRRLERAAEDFWKRARERFVCLKAESAAR